MKKISTILILLTFLIACDQKKMTKNKEDLNIETRKTKDTTDNNAIKSELVDPNPDDGIPPERYSPHNSNIEVAAKIKGFLMNQLLKDDLKVMTKNQRKFQYEEVDLNNDGKKEYLIGFKNSYFCGSGGCTYYLLQNNGAVITIFTVSDAPFISLILTTNGWRDLLVNSNGSLRLLQFDGKTYPSNPSIAKVFNETPSDDAYRLLWDKFPIPAFSF
ncbi:MAG: hypothetical protein L3J34_02685 [Flavobacteriaceae bacterium]|nr:hypothetical protein [Flavobacteriaceae bacterium]